jgi:hypothetical protein
VFPNIPDYDNDFGPDRNYSNAYCSIFSEAKLPTPQMFDLLLPEGVVDNGGHAAGFLYFEKVDNDEKDIAFRADLADAASGRFFGTITIPFTLYKKR